MNSHGYSMRKTKMDLKGGRRLSQTTSKEKEKSLL